MKDTTDSRGLSIAFIDKNSYETLIDANYTSDNLANDIYNILNYGRTSVKLSPQTYEYLSELNIQIFKMFGIGGHLPITAGKTDESIAQTVNDILTKKTSDVYQNTVEKYYDFTITPSGVLLVIVKEGFLSILTESKDEYSLFVLSVLSHQYNFSKTIEGLDMKNMLGSYINLKLNDNYLDLIKLLA